MLKVCKFGGTSMATAESIKGVEKIIRAEESRRFVVVSAPGKRFSGDEKVTDLLYKCYDDMVTTHDCSETFAKIRARFKDIADGLGVNIDEELDCVYKAFSDENNSDFFASRGEYLSAVLFAKYMKFSFVDAADIIAFNVDGTHNESLSFDLIETDLKKYRTAVIPGFYGAFPDGTIKTFSRGGSDITGAIVAGGLDADIYENWTDVNGFMMADPRLVENPRKIDVISYAELRELSYMGASVLHADSVYPLRYKKIPINIKNTFAPENAGTMIVPGVEECGEPDNIITGIAGKKGFLSYAIEKSFINNEIGFMRKVLSVFEQYNVSVEHMPSGIDTVSVIVNESEIKGKYHQLRESINKMLNPDKLTITDKIALIATVGHGMSFKIGTAARLFKALSDADINIKMIDQGSSELNIIVGVDEADYDKAIVSIYSEFMK